VVFGLSLVGRISTMPVGCDRGRTEVVEAKPTSLLKLIQKASQFVIPIYQRTYNWTDKQCKQLWDDIERAARDATMPSHFLGSIVYIHAGLATQSSVPELVVIDGQQRLTTLSLLLIALREHMEAGHPGTDITTKKISNYYLVNNEEEGELRRKLILTQNDRDTLIALVEGRSLPKVASQRIKAAYDLFAGELAATDLGPDQLWQGISKLMVVDIALERGKDNPQLIFESLNSTGLRLSETDKIRNYVLMDLPAAAQRTLYQAYWYPMEDGFDPDNPVQFDGFVRDYLTMKTRKIPNIQEIYPRFKTHMEQQRVAGLSTEVFLADLHRYATYYVRMARLLEPDPQLRAAFADLNEFRMYVAYPFLLEVYDDYERGKRLTRDEFVQVVRLVESYGFRRSVYGLATNSLNKTFQNLGKDLDKSRYLESLNLAFLLMRDQTRFPTDVEFKDRFTRHDVYNSPRVKYVLRKLENYGRKELVKVSEYTIEHIMPQNPNLSPEWQAELGTEWQLVHVKYLHTIGNLTLTGYNDTLSDRPFLEKRNMKGGFKDSPIRLNQYPAEQDHWNEDTIQRRAQELAELAGRIWGAPSVPDEVRAKFLPKTAYPLKQQATMEEVLEKSPAQHRALFLALRDRILAIDPAIIERPYWDPNTYPSNHTSYQLKSTFADVVLQDRWVRICLNIRKDQLDDPRDKARDVTGKDYLGGGDVLVTLTQADELDYSLDLIKQAYMLQAGDNGDSRDFYVALGEGEHRSWQDCVRYGFVAAGHGRRYSKPLEQLTPGARVFVHVPRKGYVGVGTVQEGPVPAADFRVQLDGAETRILEVPLHARRMTDDADNPEMAEYLVRVEWLKTVPIEESVWEAGMFANQTVVCRLRDPATLSILTDRFGLAPKKQWNAESYFAELSTRQDPDTVQVARDILAWASARVSQVSWGQGSSMGSFVPTLQHNGSKHPLFAVWTSGFVEIYFQWYQYKEPFKSEQKRQALLSRLNAIDGVSLPSDAIARRPNIDLSVFRSPGPLGQLLQTFEWFIEQVRES
jgi:uncharacterized protein with ParB-like and HNH nuclease domain/predicted transport protein